MITSLEALELSLTIAALRAERDALLQEPIDLAQMDSIDDEDGTSDKMITYYWWKQAMEARAALSKENG